METLIKNKEIQNFIDKRLKLRNMPEHEWIEQHGSGTLRKNRRIGFSYRSQYLHERICYEFGYGFEILPRSRIIFGDPFTEADCGPITEAGWHIERYIETNIFGDVVEAKYINAEYDDSNKKEGVGIIIRETSAAWIPQGHIIFSIIAEFDPRTRTWKNATNPF